MSLAETCAAQLRVERKLKCNRPSPHSSLSFLTLSSEPPSLPSSLRPPSFFPSPTSVLLRPKTPSAKLRFLGFSSIISSASHVPTREATGDKGGNPEGHNLFADSNQQVQVAERQRNGPHLSPDAAPSLPPPPPRPGSWGVLCPLGFSRLRHASLIQRVRSSTGQLPPVV